MIPVLVFPLRSTRRNEEGGSWICLFLLLSLDAQSTGTASATGGGQLFVHPAGRLKDQVRQGRRGKREEKREDRRFEGLRV
jgi:hypothetical protein